MVAIMPKLGPGGDQLAKAITFLAYMVGPRAIAHLIAESASFKNDIGSMGVFIEKVRKNSHFRNFSNLYIGLKNLICLLAKNFLTMVRTRSPRKRNCLVSEYIQK